MLSVSVLVPASFTWCARYSRGKPFCEPLATGVTPVLCPGQGSDRSEQFPITWCICFAYIKTFVLPSWLPTRVVCAAPSALSPQPLISTGPCLCPPSLSSPLCCPLCSWCLPLGGGEALPEEGEVQAGVPISGSKRKKHCWAAWMPGGRRGWQVLALPILSFISVQRRESGSQTSLNSGSPHVVFGDSFCCSFVADLYIHD